MQSLVITEDALLGAKYHVQKKLNGVTYSLDDKILSFPKKENGEGVADAVTSFFVVQRSVYDVLNKEMSSLESLLFANYIASKHALSILNYGGQEECDAFVRARINFDAPYPEPVNALIELYKGSLRPSSPHNLEAITESFFNYVLNSSLASIESGCKSVYDKIKFKEVTINGKVIKIDFQEHKVATPKVKAREVDLTVYEPCHVQTEEGGQHPRHQQPAEGSHSFTSAHASDPAVGVANGKKPILEHNYIHGHDDIKEEIGEMIFVLNDKQWFLSRYPANRILSNYLMIGPPGTGKTTLAKSLALEGGFYFIEIPCRELVNSFVNDSPKILRSHYESVKKKVLEKGYAGAIIFLDEVDAICSRRDDSQIGASRENNKVVNEFNLCLEAYLGVPIITIGATNMDQLIDDAVRSRFQVVYVGYPTTEEGVAAIYQSIMRKIEDYADTRIFDAVDFKPMLKLTAQNERFKSGRTINNILYRACVKRDIAFRKGKRQTLICTGDIYAMMQRYDFKMEDGYRTQERASLLGNLQAGLKG